MKLELKHIAQLAGNKYKCYAMGECIEDTEYVENPTPKEFTITGFYPDSNKEILIQLEDSEEDMHEYAIVDLIPIARPLSDLIKEIEINGEWFVPAELLCQIGIALGYIKDNAPTIPIDYRIIQKPFGKVLKVQKLDDWLIYFSFDEPSRAKKWIIDKLYEWHFDVDNLIENGLAIDINTLEE